MEWNRRSHVVAILLGGVMLLGPAAAEPASTAGWDLPDFDSFQIIRQPSAVPVSVDQAADILKDYDVVFVGEYHDHVANHLAEMALLRALHERVPHLALSMEQFERDVQPVVDDYLAGRIGEETLKAKGRAWKNYDEAYRPLVEYAKAHALPLIAANAPESLVHCVGQKGAGFLETLAAPKRGWAAAEIHTEDGSYKKKFLGFLKGDAAHAGPANASPASARERAERAFAAQATRDDTMAESIAAFLQARPGSKVMHVTGTFHVEDRLGTIERLKLRAPQLKIALVLPLQVQDMQAAKLGPGQGADFTILLRREPEPYASDKEQQAAQAQETSAFRAAAGRPCTL